LILAMQLKIVIVFKGNLIDLIDTKQFD
jgi:hypothetical protein